MRVIKTIVITIIMLGTTMFALNFLFGEATINLIQEHNMGSYTYYTLNMREYLQNIETSLTNTAELELKLPTRQWQDLQVDFWAQLGNNLALILDYIILAINIVEYPLRIGGYLLQQILAFLGLPVVDIIENDTPNNLAWLVKLTNVLKSMQIPYI